MVGVYLLAEVVEALLVDLVEEEAPLCFQLEELVVLVAVAGFQVVVVGRQVVLEVVVVGVYLLAEVGEAGRHRASKLLGVLVTVVEYSQASLPAAVVSLAALPVVLFPSVGQLCGSSLP